MLKNLLDNFDKNLIQLGNDITSTTAVNLILAQAIDMGASDVHIEPLPDKFIVRYRIDGILKIVVVKELYNYHNLISRIKIMANLDSTGPQRIHESETQVEYNDRLISFRVSIFPTAWGETVVFRILENVNIFDNLESIGFEKEQIDYLKKAIHNPSGMILVTGPTGHGKTTTLFSLMNILNSPEKCIVTLEDPIEYKIPLIRQTEIDANSGITFANGLRSILRQDPEIIMVGEVRDKETAHIAVDSALTGHLVLSTIHTTTSAGAVSRLLNMGIEPYLITSVVKLITAQRLVRKLCPKCKQEYTPPPALANRLNLNSTQKFYKAVGCKECDSKGFKGRIAIHEVLNVDTEIEDLIMERPNEDELYELAIKNGMKTLRHQAIKRAEEGIISLDEVLRVTEE